jgi:hypothetical protein
MKRIAYVDFLDTVRARERERLKAPALLSSARIPRKREATERVKLRLTPEQKAFLEYASAATHEGAVDPSAIVAVAIRLVEELDIQWDAVASRKDLLAAVRRRLEERR